MRTKFVKAATILALLAILLGMPLLLASHRTGRDPNEIPKPTPMNLGLFCSNCSATRSWLQWGPMHTKLLKSVVVVALLAILLGMPLLLKSHRIRLSALNDFGHAKITYDDIEDLFAAKPGYYDGFVPVTPLNPVVRSGEYVRIWCSRHGWIVLWFDNQSHEIRGAAAGPSEPNSWWARLVVTGFSMVGSH